MNRRKVKAQKQYKILGSLRKGDVGQVANELGCSAGYVSQVLNGRISQKSSWARAIIRIVSSKSENNIFHKL